MVRIPLATQSSWVQINVGQFSNVDLVLNPVLSLVFIMTSGSHMNGNRLWEPVQIYTYIHFFVESDRCLHRTQIQFSESVHHLLVLLVLLLTWGFYSSPLSIFFLFLLLLFFHYSSSLFIAITLLFTAIIFFPIIIIYLLLLLFLFLLLFFF
jgi:hypothetical protein